MKLSTALFIGVFSAGIAFAQTSEETIVVIKDERGNKEYNPDTNLSDKKEGDIRIDRVFMRDSETKGINNVYEISFFKKHEGKLKFLDIGLIEDASYDRASYSWKNDSVVTMMLFHTQTNQFKVVSFVKEGSHMDLAPDVVK